MGSDPDLEQVREQLRSVGDLPPTERVAVFEAVNEAIAAELAAMDEV